MNKSRIDWCDSTWNPVTGCLHGCEYCYARRICERFGGDFDGSFVLVPGKENNVGTAYDPLFVLDEKRYRHVNNQKAKYLPYPFGFTPTFHRYRLEEPARKTKPRTIFVCSMADLFGHWVPETWRNSIFDACKTAPQHRYLFLTKNPSMYDTLQYYKKLPVRENMWYGTTITGENSEIPFNSNSFFNTFVSIEPLLNEISKYGHLYSALKYKTVKWVIIGAETGNRKDKVIPKREWVENIIHVCKESGIPVFMKNNLASVWGDELIQQFPWEVK